jgi:hypothetical protein
MQIDFQGHYYSTIRASDLQRDGMSLEPSRDSVFVAEIFFSDVTREFVISLFDKDLPLPMIEQFIAEARTDLVPARES